MKKAEIQTGRHYTAKVSGNIVTVRVDAIRESPTTITTAFRRGYNPTYYDVTNLNTGRKTTFRSSAKFRGEVKFGPVSAPQ